MSLAIIQGYATFDWCVKHFGDLCHIPAIVALLIIVSGSVTGLPFIMPRNLNGGENVGSLDVYVERVNEQILA